ncbi:MAG: precorrin-6A synthase (deacetylating) [Solirubrobacteraceae bacterium]|nr:precorrin-6A synthase (deacetylating) [Solirubrobacteraceae bacterium]
MRRVLVVGVGCGHPDQVTVQAVRALDEADALLVVRKEGREALAAERQAIIDRHRTAGPLPTVALEDPHRPWRTDPDYDAAVARWQEQRAERWGRAIADAVPDGGAALFLAWGDPSLYESTLSIVREIDARGDVPIEIEVIPGVSALHALTARHAVPLNRVGRPVLVSPARLLTDGLPDGNDDVVLMLDVHGALASIPADGIDVYWGAYLGTDDELLVSGPLADVRDRIAELREEAAARKGWMFDIALLRRRVDGAAW